MKIKFKTVRQLARAIGYTPDAVYGARRSGSTSKKMGAALEMATGIPECRWVYPDKFGGNPWDELFPWMAKDDV